MVRKGQSALEYMMTYGWAILVIVIVAAVLYSLGIFSPSSSVGTGSTGFSPFTATASNCNATKFAVAFTVGGTPGGAAVTIGAVTVSSSSGFSTVPSMSASGTYNSGESFTAKGTAANACASGAHYSASLSVTYTYTNSLGQQTGTATGTVYGSGS